MVNTLINSKPKPIGFPVYGFCPRCRGVPLLSFDNSTVACPNCRDGYDKQMVVEIHRRKERRKRHKRNRDRKK